ncbi:MAG: glycosyltransferase family 4 protein [Sphingomonadales bacterium]|nr:glycosyltransferase family 4 protein [Sphingomonadales bacterium]
MHICLVYDCLFPWTVGGAERWYRALGERLAVEGHAVTYLTLRQWDENAPPAIPGVEVIAVGPRMALMAGERRRILPPLRFGAGVLIHLLRHGRRYDHVHCASFPFFSLLAIGLARPFAGFGVGVDWHEVWTWRYWREYLGPAGAIGWLVQWLCARVPQRAYVFSRLHGGRLAALGCGSTFLSGEYAGCQHASLPAAQPLRFVYAGRFIPEKRVVLLVEAFAIAYRRCPELRLELYGDGPQRARIAALAAPLGHAVAMPGFVDQATLDQAMGEACAIVQPSAREGYGMVVVEAAARGVPAILVESPDNAAVELITPEENGLVASASAEALAEALLAIASDATKWRRRTAQWYRINANRLSLTHSLAIVDSDISLSAPQPR